MVLGAGPGSGLGLGVLWVELGAEGAWPGTKVKAMGWGCGRGLGGWRDMSGAQGVVGVA